MTERINKNAGVKEYYIEFLRFPNIQARRAANDPNIPPTKAEFAEKYGVTRPTLWHWEQDPEFMRLVHNQNLKALNIAEVEKIKMALKVKAFEGNVPAAKLLLEWAGIYGDRATGPKGPQDMEIKKEVADLSDDDLKAILAIEDMEESFGE
jgi:transcriptional regulator with XRE-family HTH domain